MEKLGLVSEYFLDEEGEASLVLMLKKGSKGSPRLPIEAAISSSDLIIQRAPKNKVHLYIRLL